ncbi:MAG: PIN domain-containing protein [Desulfobacterales bacterium]
MYLLDTNILSEITRIRPNLHFQSQLRSKAPEELFTSVICVMELRYGSRLRDDFAEFWQRLEEEIVSKVSVLPIGEAEAVIAGDILSTLKTTGTMVSGEDILIAASAKANKLTMVTANTRRFSRISGLVVENWLDAV